MKLAVISTYNTKCGIAEYTHSLYKPLESELDIKYLANYDVVDRKYADDNNVLRLWKIKDTSYKAVLAYLNEWRPNIVHIQAHSAHHSIEGLRKLVRGIKKSSRNCKIYLTPHIVRTNQYDITAMKEELKMVDRIFVHSLKDAQYLMSKGTYNVSHFVHPYPDTTIRDKSTVRAHLGIVSEHVIATHGIISPHKGFLQVISTFNKVKKNYPDSLLILLTPRSVTNPSSEGEYVKIKKMIKDSSDNILLFDNFLDESILTTLLQSADIGILAYEEIGESASGAVRKFLSCGLPTIVTDIPIMDEFKNEVYKVPPKDTMYLEKEIDRLFVSADLRKQLRNNALQTARKYSFSNASELLLSYYTK